MIKIKATLSPENPSQKIDKIIQDLEDRREVMEQTKRYMINRWNTNWIMQGGIYGSWAPNSSWKEPGGMLEGNTGQLVGYFFAANESGRVTESEVSWHFEHEYAVTHSTSGLNPNPIGRKVPKRVLWDMNETDRRHIVKLVTDWVDQKVTF